MEIQDVASSGLPLIRDELTAVYRGAFTAPPYSETAADAERFADETLPRHASREGFRLRVARERSGAPVVGFVYGYRGASGQWWYDVVSEALGSELSARWMTDYFELVTLAVTPAAQGQGIGGALLDSVLADLSQRTALLTTLRAETPARRLYQKRGWRILLDDFHFPGGSTPILVMGLELSAKG